MNSTLPPRPLLAWSSMSARMSRSATRSPTTATRRTSLAPRGRRSFRRVAPTTLPGLSSERQQSSEHSVAAVIFHPEAIGRELDALLEHWKKVWGLWWMHPKGAAMSYRWAFHKMEQENIASNAAFKSQGKRGCQRKGKKWPWYASFQFGEDAFICNL